MMCAALTRSPDRLERRVRRGHVRMVEGESRQRVEFALQEALRLAELPGESEGRVYYFRRLTMDPIQARASRQTWMGSVQRSLDELAAAAVHGADSRAHLAGAVYFDSEEQVLETLLRLALLGERLPWFGRVALGGGPEPAGCAASAAIVPILERLNRDDYPKAAMAALVFAALGVADPAPLLAALPEGVVRRWLRELGGKSEQQRGSLSVRRQLAGPALLALQRAAARFGWQEPRTVWLAALAVLQAVPAMPAAVAASRGEAELRHLAAQPLGRSVEALPEDAMRASRDAGLARVSFDNGEAAARVVTRGESTTGDALDDGTAGLASRKLELAAGDVAGAARGVAPAAAAGGPPVTLSETVPGAASAGWHGYSPLQGEPTAAAGLYFLLPVLRHLGIEALLETSPELRDAGFVAHLLRRLATHAEVAAEDPILRCLVTTEPELFAAQTSLRLWAVAVRRWCRRHAGITVRQIIRRDGRVWLTRADLDVTLALSDADVRIRRAGLDIDPAWVPWLGEFGKVVRFHYRSRALGGQEP